MVTTNHGCDTLVSRLSMRSPVIIIANTGNLPWEIGIAIWTRIKVHVDLELVAWVVAPILEWIVFWFCLLDNEA